MKRTWISLLILVAIAASCKKFLEVKSDNSLAIPSNVADVQAILDNYTLSNTFYSSMPSVSDDDYYLDDAYFNTQPEDVKVAHTWEKDAYNTTQWINAYNIVYNANVALEATDNIPITTFNHKEWNNVKGQALFFRSYAFLNIAQQWAPQYDQITASTDLGIPLRLSADPNPKSVRSSVQKTYDQILNDLHQAVSLLPKTVPISSRPSKAAAYAALARTYLYMRKYDEAGLFADSALQITSNLIDFNTLNPTAAVPFQRFNAEVLLQSQFVGSGALGFNNWKVDSVLFKQYSNNDLRRTLFFGSNGVGTFGFKGSYNGSTSGANFNGLATNEMFLIRAESKARAGDKAGAMSDLNTLLQKRWKSGSFIPLTANDANDALKIVLVERRKELVGRGIRWSDLRRLNKEPGFEKTLTRIVNSKSYELKPNSKRYVFYIPTKVIEYSGMIQNER